MCIFLLVGSSACKAKQEDLDEEDVSGDLSENQEEDRISPPDLSTEEGIREYLEGEWISDYYYRGDIICKMDIDKDLNVSLSFENSYSDQPQGDYLGKITFDKIYAGPDEAPDLIALELEDTDEAGGDFFFLHRTIYDEKRVMSWFFSGNGNSIFDLADGSEDFIYTAEEIIFEKTTGEKPQEDGIKNDAFYAVYWGMTSDEKSIWLDEVLWTPPAEDESPPLYPSSMMYYENDVAESILYDIASDEISEVLGDDLMRGQVYFVTSNQAGEVIEMVYAEDKRWAENDYVAPEIRAWVFDIIEDVEEIREYLDMGMDTEFEGDILILEGEEYYKVFLGTQHENHFVREIHYAVNTSTQEVFRYNALNDQWEPVTMG